VADVRNFSLSPFVELRPGVYRAIAEPAAVTIGLVVGTNGALVIDTGSSPAQGATIRAAAEQCAGVPVVAAVVTHGHWDHLCGLAAFADLPTFGHDSVSATIGADLPDDLGVSPSDLVPPNHPLSLAKALDLGQQRVEFVHFGRGHTEGDVVVIVPGADVIFAGDLLEESNPPSFGVDCHLREWPAAIDGILGLLGENTLVVPGHGQPGDRVFAFTQRAEISALYGQVEYLIDQGVKEADAYAAGEWPFDEGTVRATLPIAYAQLQAAGKVPRTVLPLL
jgi:glyoxylase-like metal-dependent hydrolase (beta-lactamase superfamily II)